MGVTSAQTIIAGSFDLIGVTAASETPSPNDSADAFRRLNNMMGTLAIQPASIPVMARQVFPLLAGCGGPNDAGIPGGGPYLIGIGGDFNTARPNSIDGCGLLLNSSLPQPVEVPRAIYTNDAYEAIQIKDLPNQLFTGLHYKPTFLNNNLGTIYLWPVPNTPLNSIVLYNSQQLATFPSLTASYIVPNGYDEMLEYNLAVRLAGPYVKQLPPYVQQMAVESLAMVKRANYKMSDLSVDSALTLGSRRYGYNINTGV